MARDDRPGWARRRGLTRERRLLASSQPLAGPQVPAGWCLWGLMTKGRESGWLYLKAMSLGECCRSCRLSCASAQDEVPVCEVASSTCAGLLASRASSGWLHSARMYCSACTVPDR